MENTAQEHRILNLAESAVMQTLLYFAVFNYPLTEKEVFECASAALPEKDLRDALNRLCSSGHIIKQGEFYVVREILDQAVERRLKGNLGAAAIMSTAYRYSKIISRFPFVRGVCISGALSKNYFDEKGDIDYFIITAPRRLWICRTLLIICYKLLPKSKKKFWCVNYFVSEDNLEIVDKNAFTGTELAFLRPMYNYKLYEDLLKSNNWYRTFLPNKPPATNTNCARPGYAVPKRILETIFFGWGSLLDDALLKFTLRHWQKKFPEMKVEDFELQFRSRRTVCKRHNHGFQNKVLTRWKQSQVHFERSHNVGFPVY